MKVVNPFGRSIKMDEAVGASVLGLSCRCDSVHGTNYLAFIDNTTNCACGDGNGTVGTRVRVG